jgi:hypothetical protein
MKQFEHRIYTLPAPTREVAESYLPIFNQIINDLSKTNQVWVRREPEISKDVDFEREETLWYARVRYSFAPEKPFGVNKPDRAFDNDKMTTGFGLLPYVKK